MDRLGVTETFAGISLPGHLHTQESLQRASAFAFRPSDVLLVTYPKSGTTWMQEILTLIYSSGDPEPVKTVPNWARVPWLEHIYFEKVFQKKEGPRLITTHLPQQVLGTALRKAKPKVIYVARNPKDVAVSYYHFCRMAKFFPDPGSFDEFLHQFLDGTVHYGSWFEHVKGWLGCKDELRIFYITYEELHQVSSLAGSGGFCGATGHLSGLPFPWRPGGFHPGALQLRLHEREHHGERFAHLSGDHGSEQEPVHEERYHRRLEEPLLCLAEHTLQREIPAGNGRTSPAIPRAHGLTTAWPPHTSRAQGLGWWVLQKPKLTPWGGCMDPACHWIENSQATLLWPPLAKAVVTPWSLSLTRKCSLSLMTGISPPPIMLPETTYLSTGVDREGPWIVFIEIQ